MIRKTKKWIAKCKATHGDTYDYSKTIFTGVRNKSIIICKKHGEFKQILYSHFKGVGCPRCGVEKVSNSKLKSNESFIKDAKKVHGDTYDYSKVKYRRSNEKVDIICKIHGVFKQRPDGHMKYGCPKCGIIKFSSKRLKSNEEYIKDCIAVHGDKYDYSRVKYTHSGDKVEVGCRVHGWFHIGAHNHLNGRQGCTKCGILTRSNMLRHTLADFIKEAEIVHGKHYDYSRVVYVNTKTNIDIICREHGTFKQTPETHLIGGRCPKCRYKLLAEKFSSNTEEFIDKAKALHGDRYNYDKVKYVNSGTPVVIGCSKHGDFEQTPTNHFKNSGCPKCSISRGESAILLYLTSNNIRYEMQYSVMNYKYRYDFYLPDYNLYIEFNGIQHYEPVGHFGGEVAFKKQQRTDIMKRNLVTMLGGSFLVISYKELPMINNILRENLTKLRTYKYEGSFYQTFDELEQNEFLGVGYTEKDFDKYKIKLN